MSPIQLFLTVVTFLILLIILSGFPLSLRRLRRPAYLPICQPPRPETYPSQVGSPVGSFLLVLSQSVQAFPFGRRYLFSSFLTGYFRPSFSGHSFSHQFGSSLTAFFAALSFSLLSRLGRLFYRPASVARYAVKQPSHCGLVAFSACTGWVTASVVQVLISPTGRFLAAFHASRSPSLTIPIAAFLAAICTGSLTARFPAS